jgi:hypothetical protein
MSVSESAQSALVESLGQRQTSSSPQLNSSLERPSQSFLIAPLSSKAVISIGVASAVSLVIWSVFVDVAYPIAVVTGLCAFAATVCVHAALLVIRSATVSSTSNAVNSVPSAAWQIVDRFRVSDASRLWCEMEPGCLASQESMAWAHAMLDAIKRGELPVSSGMGDSKFCERERANPSWRTEVNRKDLAEWAQAHGHRPRFLCR